jgi:antitoxin (DNA-binding transcriptional repressor) of toxin-antitoxin stability system
VSVAQAKSRFAALVARAEAGETIVVTRSGRAVACLGPLPRRQPIKYGELSGLFLSDDLTIPEEVIPDFEPPNGRTRKPAHHQAMRPHWRRNHAR